MKFPARHRAIYIYPNKYGFLFVGSFVLSVLLGATYENNMLFLFGFVQLSFIFVAILVTAAEVRAARLDSLQVHSGFPGENTSASALVTNVSGNSIQFKINVGRQRGASAELNPKISAVVAIPIALPKSRGAYKIDRVRFSTSGPFLFFNCWKYWYAQADYFVFPEPIGKALPKRIEGVEIANVSGLEEYTGSQSLSRISWRHYGRSGRFMVKSAEAAPLQEYVFDWQRVSHLELEAAVSQLARWICDAELEGTPYALHLRKFRSQIGIGPRHRDQLLTELAKCQA